MLLISLPPTFYTLFYTFIHLPHTSLFYNLFFLTFLIFLKNDRERDTREAQRDPPEPDLPAL